MSPTPTIPTGGIAEPDALQAAFAGGPFGDHRLHAKLEFTAVVEGPIPFIQLPVAGYLFVQGRLLDSAGDVVGVYERAVFRNQLTGDTELWLGGFRVLAARRGGLREFQRRSIVVARDHGVALVRLTAAGIGAWAWSEDFEFDQDRLPQFGSDPGFGPDDRGLGLGAEGEELPAEGDLPRELVRRLILGALRSDRIELTEASTLLDRPELDSTAAIRALSDRDLARRLMSGARWPGIARMHP